MPRRKRTRRALIVEKLAGCMCSECPKVVQAVDGTQYRLDMTLPYHVLARMFPRDELVIIEDTGVSDRFNIDLETGKRIPCSAHRIWKLVEEDDNVQTT